jgi:hypothetical protein
MGLKSWLVRREIKGAIRDAQEGKDGEDVAKLIDFFKQHRTLFGTIFSFIAAGLAGTGHKEAGALVGMAGSGLIGAGSFESDRHHKEQ